MASTWLNQAGFLSNIHGTHDIIKKPRQDGTRHICSVMHCEVMQKVCLLGVSDYLL